ncbi:MAG: glycoside hydrolase family 57 [Thermotogae bacterium]|nr:glycoside hydrolase family 57 [Thermotogota bacterium]
MKRVLLLVLLSLSLSLPLFAGQVDEILSLVEPGDPSLEPLKLAIIWHHHQPLYKTPLERNFFMPWVRAHGVNDYPYMADLVEKYLTRGKVTFNIVPSLILQIQDYLSGATDEYMRLSHKPEAVLTEQERRFILNHFFDINPQFVNKYPRYRELMEMKVSGREFSNQDLLDLKVYWNLAWINIEYIEADPALKALVKKAKNYTCQDLELVLQKHKEFLATVLGKYKKLAEEGKIELITSAKYHPILPLLIDKGWVEDAKGQISAGLEIARRTFGLQPVGFWPPEEAVSRELIPLLSELGMEWIVTDKVILQMSGVDTSDYTNVMIPYKAENNGKSVVVFFRDTDLSDRISFKYSQMSAEEAVKDFLSRVHELQRLNRSGDLILTVALDGENAWEHYPNNGNDFRKLFYEALSADPYVELTTPKEYIDRYGVKKTLATLAKGSWAGGSLDTWIGEKEENEAWNRLEKARQVVMEKLPQMDDRTKEKAIDSLYAAEGSDWFWWYGDDQDAGNNEILFDRQFKKLLIALYELAGISKNAVPSYLLVSNKKPVQPSSGSLKKVDYMLDGKLSIAESGAALYDDTHDGNRINRVWVGRGDTGAYVAVELDSPAKSLLGEDVRVELYLDSPHADIVNALTKYSDLKNPTDLGFAPSYRLSVSFKTWKTRRRVSAYRAGPGEKWILSTSGAKAAVGEIVEFEIPFDFIGIKTGEEFNVVVVVAEKKKDTDTCPNTGPVRVKIPKAVSGDVLAEFVDPEGDEYGPGTYTYPKDPAFEPFKGLFDVLKARVLENEEALVFQFWFGEMTNPWNAPKGFSHQIVNIYLDTKNGGRTDTYHKGARVQFDPKHPWDYFVKAAGWPSYGQLFATSEGEEIPGAIMVEADPGGRLINVIVLRKYLQIIGDEIYAYLLFGSQDGYGPDNFRPVTREAGQWTLGGYPEDAGDYGTYVVDVILPEGIDQREALSSYDAEKQQFPTVYPVKIRLK